MPICPQGYEELGRHCQHCATLSCPIQILFHEIEKIRDDVNDIKNNVARLEDEFRRR